MQKNKTIYNSLVSVGCQIIILALGLIVPRVIMISYGSDTNGFTSTLTQIFSYLALLEAGITQSTAVQLYKHLKDNNKQGISYVMSASRRYFRKLAVIYFLAVIILSFTAPLFLKTEIPYLTIFFYILFEGLTSVVTFYSISLCRVFLNTNGKSYIVNYINVAQKILQYAVKIGLALIGLNIAFIQVGYFLVSLIQLAVYTTYMKKNYSWIDYKSAPKGAELPDRNAFVITELAMTVFKSTDMIILSTFVATALSSVYSTYNMVFVAIETLITSIYNSIKYNLGRTYHVGITEYSRLHDVYNSIFVGATTTCMSVTYILILPFIKLYTQGITDVEYIYRWLPLLFCMVNLLSRSRSIAGNLSGIAGYAKPVSYVSMLEAIVNITLSLALVKKFGIYGVLVATVVALPLKVIYVNYLAEKRIMKRNGIKTVLIIGTNYLFFFAICFIKEIIPIKINSYLQFFIIGAFLTLIIAVVVFAINCLVNRDLRVLLKRRVLRSAK